MRILPLVIYLFLCLWTRTSENPLRPLCQTKGTSGDVQGGPCTVRRQDWTFPGNEHWRDKFACDTSSALEWCGLFTVCCVCRPHVIL
ncbi:hypothetical protein L210DRAFT_3578692 [Boletus edulis BED1]|uniref:Uncharacterized protein n=1 Tax=Boletus edulis BED1 TaxID=1328754 RepID=A0AAD4BCR5_BOLED|nr:hypothetical protein L210DRAFT_3578692 [Boletus edulis BED1]